MTLEQLKALMGIALSDTSQDVILSLYLGAAIKAAKKHADMYDWDSQEPLPEDIQLGILRWIELSQLRKNNAGVQSESIAGMSQTFTSTVDANYFAEAYELWEPYHFRGLTFRPTKRSKPPCDPRMASILRRL